MKEYCYEMCVIFSPEIENEREKHYSRLRDLLESEGVELIAEKDWGMRKFAYPIQKHTSGFYSFFYFKAEKTTPKKIAEDFKMQEDVLRHLILKRTIGKDINLESLTRDEDPFAKSSFDSLESETEEKDTSYVEETTHEEPVEVIEELATDTGEALETEEAVEAVEIPEEAEATDEVTEEVIENEAPEETASEEAEEQE